MLKFSENVNADGAGTPPGSKRTDWRCIVTMAPSASTGRVRRSKGLPGVACAFDLVNPAAALPARSRIGFAPGV